MYVIDSQQTFWILDMTSLLYHQRLVFHFHTLSKCKTWDFRVRWKVSYMLWQFVGTIHWIQLHTENLDFRTKYQNPAILDTVHSLNSTDIQVTSLEIFLYILQSCLHKLRSNPCDKYIDFCMHCEVGGVPLYIKNVLNLIYEFRFLGLFSLFSLNTSHWNRNIADWLSVKWHHSHRDFLIFSRFVIWIIFEREQVKCTFHVSLITCLRMTGSMMVAIAWHTCWERPCARDFPGESWGTLLTKLACKSQGTGTGFHPWSGVDGWTRRDDSWGKGYPCKLWCVWKQRRKKDGKSVCHKTEQKSAVNW